MKKILTSIVVLIVVFIVLSSSIKKHGIPEQAYPWQIKILADGKTQVFNVVFGETRLKAVDTILQSEPTVAVFESKDQATLEAYYKSVAVGGLTGDFIFTLETTKAELEKLKKESKRQKHTEDNAQRFDLDKNAIAEAKKFPVKNLIYIPVVQLDQAMVVRRFGEPGEKIKTSHDTGEEKAPEVWHYLYPDKGLDVIIHEKGKEVMQYVSPEEFNVLREPLLRNQNPSR
jgi:hypothetical protein